MTSKNHKATNKPKYSIIIPAYNEAALISLCLQSIDDQDYKGEYEVIVVDNASTDRTAAIARAYEATVLFEPRRGIVYARHTGFAAAKGEILVSTDADSIVPPNWLSEFDRILKDQRYSGVVGGLELNGADTIGKKFARLMSPLWTMLNTLFGGVFTAANFALRAEAYQAVGGFDLDYQVAEDVALAKALKKADFRLKRRLRLRVKTSARRFGKHPFSAASQYLSAFWSSFIRHRPIKWQLDPIRQKAFDINNRIIKRPMLFILLIILIAGIIYASFDPKVSIYSQSRIKTDKKIIALTFDDGPCDPYTLQILNILKHQNIKATFFVVGENVRRYPEIAKSIVDDGNQIANHSDNHDIKLMLERPGEIRENIAKSEASIKSATGLEPTFFRPSYGFRSWWGARALSRDGYNVVTWDNMTYDYAGLGSAKIVSNIVRQAKPGGIIVLHDGREAKEENVNRGNVVAALPLVIDILKQQGYTFVTLEELFDKPAYRY